MQGCAWAACRGRGWAARPRPRRRSCWRRAPRSDAGNRMRAGNPHALCMLHVALRGAAVLRARPPPPPPQTASPHPLPHLMPRHYAAPMHAYAQWVSTAHPLSPPPLAPNPLGEAPAPAAWHSNGQPSPILYCLSYIRVVKWNEMALGNAPWMRAVVCFFCCDSVDSAVGSTCS